jgi:hypothetical protein
MVKHVGGIGLAALALALGASGCGDLSPAELQRQADMVDSTAAEGGLLAEQVADDRTMDTFVRVHAGDLSDQMDHTQAKLQETEDEGEVPTELRDDLAQTIQLARDTQDALDELVLNPHDELKAASAREKLEQISDAAARVGDRL